MPIVIYGSKVLRKKSFDLGKPDELASLAGNMLQTMKKHDGIGLAGPQVGVLKNIFVIDTSIYESKGIERVEKAYINPEIVNLNGQEVYFNEGCLSIPGIFEDVKRPEKIEVRYRDIDFQWHEEILDSIVARIFQHEYDHLQGILFIDRLSAIRKKLIRSKLNQIKNMKRVIIKNT